MESVILKEMNSLLLPCNPASLFLNATEATCDLKRHTTTYRVDSFAVYLFIVIEFTLWNFLLFLNLKTI